MSTVDTSILVQVGDEFARKNFNLQNEEVWILDTYNLKKGALQLTYGNTASAVSVSVNIERLLLEQMALEYVG